MRHRSQAVAIHARAGINGAPSHDGARHREDRRQGAGQALPRIAAIDARVHLAVAGADVDALVVEAVGVEPISVDALVIVRAGRRASGAPGSTGIAGAVNGELAVGDAEIVVEPCERQRTTNTASAALR